jgi:MYXO-CTERM domain-containing protein
VADSSDTCSGYDDAVDVDADGIPDGCDSLIDSDGEDGGDGEETLAGQCTCPDGSKGQMVGPADDDGVDDGCLCATGEDDSLPAISLIPALLSIGIIALRRRY